MKNGSSILLVGSQMAVAGAQNLLLYQADWLHAQRYSVTVVFLYDRDGLQSTWQKGRDYPILALQARRIGAGQMENLRLAVRGLARLWRLLRSKRFAAVQAFTHDANLFALPVAWLAGVPVRLATHHGLSYKFKTVMLRLHALMVNIGLATRLVAVSEDTTRQALREGVRPNRLETIVNGVPDVPVEEQTANLVRERLGMSLDDRLVVSVGRLVPEKAYSNLLEAVACLQTGHSLRLAILGEGPLRADLERKAAQLEIADRVLFPGVRDDRLSWIAAADVFTLSSRSEGLPLVLLEAMSLGKTIVSTNVSSIRDILLQGECGYLVPPDDVKLLAEALDRALTDRPLSAQLGAAARREYLAHYTLERMCRAYQHLLVPGSEIR